MQYLLQVLIFYQHVRLRHLNTCFAWTQSPLSAHQTAGKKNSFIYHACSECSGHNRDSNKKDVVKILIILMSFIPFFFPTTFTFVPLLVFLLLEPVALAVAHARQVDQSFSPGRNFHVTMRKDEISTAFFLSRSCKKL